MKFSKSVPGEQTKQTTKSILVLDETKFSFVSFLFSNVKESKIFKLK